MANFGPHCRNDRRHRARTATAIVTRKAMAGSNRAGRDGRGGIGD